MNSEINFHDKNNTWDLVSLPPNKTSKICCQGLHSTREHQLWWDLCTF